MTWLRRIDMILNVTITKTKHKTVELNIDGDLDDGVVMTEEEIDLTISEIKTILNNLRRSS
jgi:hypothetical protein